MGDGGREEIWQDFGLHVNEATRKLISLIDDVLPVVGTLVIITGRGAHNRDGDSKLRPAIEKLAVAVGRKSGEPVEGKSGARSDCRT